MGYQLFDPQSGSGAYRIAGGENGGRLHSSKIRKQINGLIFVYAAGPKLAKVVAGVSVISTLVEVLNHLNTLVGAVRQCGNNINIANALAIFALFAFLAAELAIAASNPFLALLINMSEIAAWNILFEKALDGLC